MIDTWTGGSLASPISPNWTDANNWSRGGSPGVPQSGDSLVFPAGAQQLVNTDNIGTLTIASITFTGTGYTINSNTGTINLGSGGLSVGGTAGAGNNALNVGMTFLNAETFTVATSGQVLTDSLAINNGGFPLTVTGQGNMTLSGVISGAGALTKGLTAADVGTLTLGGANSFTGAATINAGVLAAGAAGALGAASTTVSTMVNSGATLQLTSAATYNSRPLVLNGPGFLNQARSRTST